MALNTRLLSHVLCFPTKRPTGLKYEKAREWSIPCVNAQWLGDILLGDFEALRQARCSRYAAFGLPDPFAPTQRLVWSLLGEWAPAPVRSPKGPVPPGRRSLVPALSSPRVLAGRPLPRHALPRPAAPCRTSPCRLVVVCCLEQALERWTGRLGASLPSLQRGSAYLTRHPPAKRPPLSLRCT